MKNTGEQLIPGISSKRLLDEHVLRYDFAKTYIAGKDVLDIACGTGYGSYELSKVVRSVVGADISKESVDFANQNYVSSNLRYVMDDATKLKNIEDNIFDIVVSFETIEHLDKQGRSDYLKNISNVLKPGGIFILSTPNKKLTSPFSKHPLNKFHAIEFTKDLLVDEISVFFEIKKMYGQRFIKSIFVTKTVWYLVKIIEKIFRHDFGLYTTKASPEVSEWIDERKEPRIIIIIAQKK